MQRVNDGANTRLYAPWLPTTTTVLEYISLILRSCEWITSAFLHELYIFFKIEVMPQRETRTSR